MKQVRGSHPFSWRVSGLFAGLLMLLSAPVFAEHKYNPYTQRWETVAPNSVLKYNPYEREWEYAQPGSKPTYNPYEHQWEFDRK